MFTLITRWLTVAVGLVICFGVIQAATPPERLNYQGVLRDSAGAPLGGARAMTLRLYDSDGGGLLRRRESAADRQPPLGRRG